MKKYLLLPHLEIHNANAISSNYIIGFPAMTAWLGSVHALERKIRLSAGFADISFYGAGVVVHNYQMHTYRLKGNINNSLSITANPLKKKGKDFERPPIIPEGRIDMDVSILVDVTGIDATREDELKNVVLQLIPTMRWAGGEMTNFFDKAEIEIYTLDDDSPQQYRKLVSKLMPGYAILERRDLLLNCSDNETCNKCDAMDSLLDLVQVHEVAELDESKKVIGWNKRRKKAGWLIPLAVGYKAISPVDRVLNQRDMSYEHQFVESVVTLGEFKPLYRIKNIDDLIWQYQCDNNLYVCVNQKI